MRFSLGKKPFGHSWNEELDGMKKIKFVMVTAFLIFAIICFSKDFAVLVGVNDYVYLNNLSYAEKGCC